MASAGVLRATSLPRGLVPAGILAVALHAALLAGAALWRTEPVNRPEGHDTIVVDLAPAASQAMEATAEDAQEVHPDLTATPAADTPEPIPETTVEIPPTVDPSTPVRAAEVSAVPESRPEPAPPDQAQPMPVAPVPPAEAESRPAAVPAEAAAEPPPEQAVEPPMEAALSPPELQDVEPPETGPGEVQLAPPTPPVAEALVPVETLAAQPPQEVRPAPRLSRPISARPETTRRIRNAASAGATASAGTTAAIGGQAARADPNVMNGYVTELRRAIERRKRYPASADGAEGTAVVRFTVDRSGSVSGSILAHGSGHAALDAAAIEIVRGANLPAFPDGLTQARMTVSVPLQFRPR